MAELFRHAHRVTYAECTVGDHIYHSRYLDLLEAARGEFMRALGTPVLALLEADYIFPRHRGAAALYISRALRRCADD